MTTSLSSLAHKYGTPRQIEIAEFLQNHSTECTAAMLGITPSRVRGAMAELRARAEALQSLTPEDLLEHVDSERTQTIVEHDSVAPARRRPTEARGDGPARKHLVIPDPQCKPGGTVEHLRAAGNYAAAKRPDVIVILGDWWDMPSLSSYDRGKRSAENRRYRADIEAGQIGLAEFMSPIWAELHNNTELRRAGDPTWWPRVVFLCGNHEERIARYVNDHAVLEGVIGYDDFQLDQWGIEFHGFQKVVEIDGILYSHMFPRDKHGRVSASRRTMGAPSAQFQLDAQRMSCIAGHRQGFEQASGYVGDRRIRSIIAGSFYPHAEHYLGAQGDTYWRGVLMLHEVNNGDFNLCEVSLDYLMKRYL